MVFKTSGRAALITLAATGYMMGGVAAQAADLGGNCCSDLEERVAELEATTARKGNRRVSLEVYGQVHQAVLWHNADTPFRADQSVINGAQSGTRFGFKGTAKINSDVSAGYRIEIAAGGFQSPIGASLASPPGASTGALSTRFAEVFITSKSLGSIYMGHTSMATDNIVKIDLGETGVASAGLSLAPVDSALIGVSILPFDGGRANAIRYVSPTLGGFVLSAAWSGDNGRTFDDLASEGDSWDVALRYAGEFGQIRVAAGIGYREDNGLLGPLVGAGVDTKSYLASASVMHTTSGLFVSGSYGRQEMTGVDGDLEGYSVRGGISKKMTAHGLTKIFVEYGELNKVLGTDIRPKLYGAGIIQEIDAAAMDLYFSWRQIDTDIEGIDKADTFLVGARIKF